MRCLYCHNPDTWPVGTGKKMHIDEVVEQIRPFVSLYLESGGGLTVSGGEPLLQASALSSLFRAIKSKWNLPIALDTSGFGGAASILPLLPFTDLVILDRKASDDPRHRELTGQPLHDAIECGNAVAQAGVALQIRHVVIPGITDQPSDWFAIAEQARGWHATLEFLPYHKMGSSKWPLVGLMDPLAAVPEASTSLMAQADQIKKAVFDHANRV